MLATIFAFINAAIIQGIPLLFGATGEIITEKSGNLNLGIPGIMYIGAMVSITNIKRIISSICVLFPLFSFLLLIICSPPITYFFDRFF